MHADISKLRTAIDKIDAELVKFLALRASISRKIGVIKKVSNIKAVDKAREKQLLQTRVDDAEKKGLSPTFTRSLFKLIHDESVRIQKTVL